MLNCSPSACLNFKIKIKIAIKIQIKICRPINLEKTCSISMCTNLRNLLRRGCVSCISLMFWFVCKEISIDFLTAQHHRKVGLSVNAIGLFSTR
jgi:hypothetical protein